jgi:hypothetical protein
MFPPLAVWSFAVWSLAVWSLAVCNLAVESLEVASCDFAILTAGTIFAGATEPVAVADLVFFAEVLPMSDFFAIAILFSWNSILLFSTQT